MFVINYSLYSGNLNMICIVHFKVNLYLFNVFKMRVSYFICLFIIEQHCLYECIRYIEYYISV